PPGVPVAPARATPTVTPGAMPAAIGVVPPQPPPMARAPTPQAIPAAQRHDDDPFANISLDPAPMQQSGRGSVLRAAVEAASETQRVQLREPGGALTEFGHIAPARQWVANHPTPDELEVSVGGGAFVSVRISPHFQDLPRATVPAPAARPSATPSSTPVRRATGAAMLVQSATPEKPRKPRMSSAELLAGSVALSLTGVVAVLGVVFMLWARGVPGLDASLNRMAVEQFGARSPRYAPPVDASFMADMVLQEAENDRARGRFAHAVVGYRKVLQLRPDDEVARVGLIRAYSRLGDCGSAKAAGGPGCIAKD
ncbi:MAG: hypothetical protein AB2A00_41380, partial [Myxococcota bacterium]